jgi:hypothetical protein
MAFDRYEDLDEDQQEAAAHEARIKRCKSCNAKIIWMLTKNLKHIPIDADTVEAGDTQLDLSKHKSHFATCRYADSHRNPR